MLLRLVLTTFLWLGMRSLSCGGRLCVRRRLSWLLRGWGVFSGILCARRLVASPLLPGRPEGLLVDIARDTCISNS